jgi:CubicO group peptidase (beta-lactamase class C family)
MPDLEFFAESPEAVGLDPARVDDLLTRAEKEVRGGLLPSSQIAIARDGKIAAMRTVGEVTHQGKTAPAGDETLYCIFSCTKAITSAAAWLLIQENRFGIDERVADIIPEFGTNGKEVVRVEQLFTHTAGFPHAPYHPLQWTDRTRRAELFARWKLNWEPGSKFEYHPSSSMWVIREICERRSGEDFRDFVSKRIADPLGLPDLMLGVPPAQHGRLADCVHVGEAMTPDELEAQFGLRELPESEVTEDAILGFNRADIREAGNPGGGAFTSAADLALFYQALLTGRGRGGVQIWKPETLRMAREVRSGDLVALPAGKKANRALGLIIAGDDDKHFRGFGRTGSDQMFGHGGAGGQIGWADPVSGISLGYCTNGHDRHMLRQGRRGVGLSSRAGGCLAQA